MSISINRYVDITSGVVGAQLTGARSLCALRFTTDPKVPAGSVVTFTDEIAKDAAALFGSSSPDAEYAAQYAAYISPPPASKADTLRFAAYVNADREPRIFGAKIAPVLASFTAVTAGTLPLTLGEVSVSLSGLNFSTALTLADVASILQVAVRAADLAPVWATATVSYDAVSTSFNLVGGSAGVAPVALGVAIAGDVGTLFGWRAALTIMSPGAAAQEPVEALQVAEQVTDSFGTFSYAPAGAITLDEAEAVAVYNAGLNVKYQFYYVVSLATAAEAYTRLAAYASTGLILNRLTDQYKESLPAAVGAAIDYDRTNAVVNVMYRQGPFPNDADDNNDVFDNTTANGLDANRVNYYGTTSNAGQKLSFFQRGYLLGGATAPLDMNVHFNEQWLKSALQSDFISGQIALAQIGANDQGRGIIFGLLQGRIEQSKRNGVISIGKTLTTLQQIAVTQLTGDVDAWRDVQSNGYWADVVIVPYIGPSETTEYKAVYTLVYSKNDVVRKIEGSHNLV
jgi:hypothetical protein